METPIDCNREFTLKDEARLPLLAKILSDMNQTLLYYCEQFALFAMRGWLKDDCKLKKIGGG